MIFSVESIDFSNREVLFMVQAQFFSVRCVDYILGFGALQIVSGC